MARQKKRSTTYSTMFMVLLTVILITLLAVLYQVTQPTIDRIEAVQKSSAILNSAGLSFTNENVDQIFEQSIRDISAQAGGKFEPAKEVYEVLADGELTGYVFQYIGGALWGEVEGYIGVDKDFQKILGIDILRNNETPGLGGRITEAWFKDQFKGLEIKDQDFIIYRPNQGGNVDAITGATQTSNSMSKIFNKEITEFVKIMKGGQ